MKEFVNINNDKQNIDDTNDANDTNDAISIIDSYNRNNKLSLNSIFGGLNIDKFVTEKICRQLMDYSFECSFDDEIIHTFKLLTNKDKKWIDDNKRSGCYNWSCSIFFNRFNHRRHHCRSCGEIFCSNCSN